MGKTKVIELTAEQRAEAEKGCRTGQSHCFRLRCRRMILPESEKRTLIKAAEVLGNCGLVVNSRLARYETEGRTGLAARTTADFIAAEVKKQPNSVKIVIAKLAENRGLEMSPDTLKRFLKKMG